MHYDHFYTAASPHQLDFTSKRIKRMRNYTVFGNRELLPRMRFALDYLIASLANIRLLIKCLVYFIYDKFYNISVYFTFVAAGFNK